MRVRHLLLVVRVLALLLVCAYALQPAPAAAHPLGNFTVNRYSRIAVGPEQLTVFYVLDMAEIPTFQELTRIDSDGDGQLSDTEQTAYATSTSSELRNKLQLQLADRPLPLQLDSYAIEFPVGQGGLKTLRLTLNLSAALPAAARWAATYTDTNYSDRLGWKEIVVAASDGARLIEADVPNQDSSQELRNYPADLLQSPLDVSSASFRFEATAGTTGGASASPSIRTRCSR
ncbi:hypothetical protein HC891_06930 [Candidatus Gracilibacteria bacterium]|nr:hypothetical protein [Candidatus Gracilibacteria bacterium]